MNKTTMTELVTKAARLTLEDLEAAKIALSGQIIPPLRWKYVYGKFRAKTGDALRDAIDDAIEELK